MLFFVYVIVGVGVVFGLYMMIILLFKVFIMWDCIGYFWRVGEKFIFKILYLLYLIVLVLWIRIIKNMVIMKLIMYVWWFYLYRILSCFVDMVVLWILVVVYWYILLCFLIKLGIVSMLLVMIKLELMFFWRIFLFLNYLWKLKNSYVLWNIFLVFML